MYYISKRLEISGAHKLNLNYESKCSNIHGHNWIVTIYCKSDRLDENGMIVDFTTIKEKIHSKLDHKYINDILPDMNPTAENIAKWIASQVTDCCKYGRCYRVDIQESEGNIATYISEGGEVL